MQDTTTLFTQFPVTSHTDFVMPGGTFVAVQGFKEDGAHYILQALERGAKTVVVEQSVTLSVEVQEALLEAGARLERVEDARKSLAQLSAQAAGNPAQHLKIFGVTGTKGKTTTSWMLGYLLAALGKKVAFVTGAGFFLTTDGVTNQLADFQLKEHLTTPQADFLHQFFKLCVEKEVEYVVLEVAVQAVTFQRIHGIQFDGIIFTNLDREHAELYPSMDQYFSEKTSFFNQAKADAVLMINGQDEYGKKLLEKYPQAFSFGAYQQGEADRQEEEKQPDGSTLLTTFYKILKDFDYAGDTTENASLFESEVMIEDVKKAEVIKLSYQFFPGEHNLLNFLAAASLLRAKGLDLTPLEGTTLSLKPVPGRMEFFQLPNQVFCCIDYAHTAASIEAVLKTVREYVKSITVVFGAAGGKDSYKRPLMGRSAGKCADRVFITSDNPRDEDPAKIAQQVLKGVKPKHRQKVTVELDRERAVIRAYHEALPGTMIMLLGKGADEGQIVKGIVEPYSDKYSIYKIWYVHEALNKVAAAKNTKAAAQELPIQDEQLPETEKQLQEAA